MGLFGSKLDKIEKYAQKGNAEKLKAMVNAIHNVEISIGSDDKKPAESEKKNI